MTRCFLRVLVLAVVTILGLALSPTAVAAAVPTAISTEAYTYDASVYEGVLTYTAPERGPPTQAEKQLVSAGHNAVLHWSHGTLARSHGSATAVTLDYDDRLQFAQVAHGGNTNPERLGAAAGAPFSLPDSNDAANGAAPRFIGNSAGDLLDTTRVTIPEGKFGYLLKNPSKSGVFKDSMGFDQAGLDSALRSHLTTNFGNASASVPMTGGGTKFVVRGPLTGPSGQTWNITSAWGVDVDGTIRLITATP